MTKEQLILLNINCKLYLKNNFLKNSNNKIYIIFL